MTDEAFKVGTGIWIASDSSDGSFGAYFEEDDATGYFYAITLPDHTILDAMHIYNIASVVDVDRPSTFRIVWAEEGIKCALLINDYPHAVFDFEARRGYCRTNYPNSPDGLEDEWLSSDHRWSDDAAAWLWAV